jgi:hypothetical protein
VKGACKIPVRLEQAQKQRLWMGVADADGAERHASRTFRGTSPEETILDRSQRGRIDSETETTDR